MSQINDAAGLMRGRHAVRSKANTEKRHVAVCGARTFLGKKFIDLLAEDPSVQRLVVIDAGPLDLGAGASARARAYAHDLESVGTLNILNACRERPVRKFVLGSLTALYGPHFDNPNFLTENHALRGLYGTSYLSDKVDAERQVEAFAREQRSLGVTVLRFAPLLGPTVESFITRWLARPFVPVLLGYDPLLQFVHEVDALSALRVAIDSDASGVFNVVGDGVLPLSTVVKLLGRHSLPMPHFVARRLFTLLWAMGLSEVPAPMLRFLRHLCVADGDRIKRELGVQPAYTTREAVLAFGAALRMREARLLTEAYG